MKDTGEFVEYQEPKDPKKKKDFQNRLELLIRKNERRVKRVSKNVLETDDMGLSCFLIYKINSMGGEAIGYGWDFRE